MKRKLLALFLAAALLLSCVACGNDASEKKTNDLKKITFVLDWTPNTNHTGLYVALANGYYKDAGFDVDIIQPPEDGATSLVASNKAQFGIDFQDFMADNFARKDPLPFTAVATIIQHNTSGILSRKGDGITSPKGMTGKTYASLNLPIEQQIIRDLVDHDGGNSSKVDMIPNTVTDEVSALKSKSIDSVWVYEGWGKTAADVANFDYDFFSMIDIDDTFDYYTPVIIANDNYLKENPEDAKAFLAATKKGYEYAVEHPDKAADILLEAAPELDETLVKKSQEYMATQYIADAKEWGVIDAARWNKFYRWLNKNNLVDGTLKDNVGFTNDYLK